MNAPASLIHVPDSAIRRDLATIEPTSLLQAITRAASDPAIDIDKMQRLMEMHERIQSQDAEAAFNRALSAAQAEMQPVRTDAENTHTSSRYATYAALDRAVRPIYTKHGLSLSFDEGDCPKPDHIRVLCYVACGGFTRTYRKDVPADGKGAKGGDVMTKTHATGAADSYGMRYLLRKIFNIAVGEDDNDGNALDYDRITDKQAADLLALVTEVGASLDSLLNWLKLERLADLPAESYTKVVRAVEAKRKAPAGKPSQVRR